MNACGVQSHWWRSFVESEQALEECIEDYYFTEWYEALVDAGVPTIPARVFERAHLDDGTVDAHIATLPRGECFARLDTCSSKPDRPYTSAAQIADSLAASDRTRDAFHKGMLVVVRPYVHLVDEFRCYFHDGTLRGVSGCPSHRWSLSLQALVCRARHCVGYEDCCIDWGFVDDAPVLIEINTPVYACGTSGAFDLDNEGDRSILVGAYDPDVHPVVRAHKRGAFV